MRVQRRRANLIVIIGVILIFWLILHFLLHSNSIAEPYVIAHRGGAGIAPENTMIAIDRAIDRDVRNIEVDVQRTSDNILILMHDSTVDRTTNGKGYVSKLTWREIEVLDAGSHFSEEFNEARVPTLRDVVDKIVSNNTMLYLEVKNPSHYPGIKEQIQELIAKADAGNNVIVLSFDHKWLDHFSETTESMRSGRIYTWIIGVPDSNATTLMSVHWTNVVADPSLIRRVHNKGYELVVWTVDNPWLVKMMLKLGVDGIITDRPDLR